MQILNAIYSGMHKFSNPCPYHHFRPYWSRFPRSICTVGYLHCCTIVCLVLDCPWDKRPWGIASCTLPVGWGICFRVLLHPHLLCNGEGILVEFVVFPFYVIPYNFRALSWGPGLCDGLGLFWIMVYRSLV